MTRSAPRSVREGARRALLGGALLVATACVGTRQRPSPPVTPVGHGAGNLVRIALDTKAEHVVLSATGNWLLESDGGASLHLRSSDAWPIERDGSFLYAAGGAAGSAGSRSTTFTARSAANGSFITVNGRRYRGEIQVTPTDAGLLVVNRLPVDEYLRGVVPIEIGGRRSDEQAAVEAQAVAARSYAYSHMRVAASRPYDMLSTVMDQAYGGVKVETAASDAAIAKTAGLVLTYKGRIVTAPYHAVCGGRTAAPSEVWPGGHDEPYLRSVSDRIPGTNRYYCDIAPNFHWTRTLSGDQLAAVLQRYLRAYVNVPGGVVGAVRQVKVDATTKSGRVRSVTIRTDRGRYTLRANQIRFVLRTPGGAILHSTAFRITERRGSDGHVSRLTLSGAGNGHGIGMCQWGAIGRARAGQDYRTILRAYYPGTTIERVG